MFSYVPLSWCAQLFSPSLFIITLFLRQLCELPCEVPYFFVRWDFLENLLPLYLTGFRAGSLLPAWAVLFFLPSGPLMFWRTAGGTFVFSLPYPRLSMVFLVARRFREYFPPPIFPFFPFLQGGWRSPDFIPPPFFFSLSFLMMDGPSSFVPNCRFIPRLTLLFNLFHPDFFSLPLARPFLFVYLDDLDPCPGALWLDLDCDLGYCSFLSPR